jgi:hypothetical protein
MKEWPDDGIRGAFSTVLGWSGVILATLVLGFLSGYWIGHRGIPPFEQTVRAFAVLPLLWVANVEMFAAYAVLGLAWYLPLRYEWRELRVGATAANFLVWLAIIAWMVVKWSDSKFFRF